MVNTSRAARACDGCRFRKVKCNGATPCSQCAHLALKCTTSSVPRRRNPGARGRLVEQLRQGGTGAPPVPQGVSADKAQQRDAAAADGPSPHGGSVVSESAISPTTPVLGRSFFSQDFFIRLLPEFDENVYPVNPIVTVAEIRLAIENMHNSFEDAALVYAFGALTINLGSTSNQVHGTLTELMDMSLSAHRSAEFGSARGGSVMEDLPVSVKRIATCIYLEICMMAYKLWHRAFAILREAISMIQVMHRQSQSLSTFSSNPHENARRRLIYWELFIHERVLTIQTGLPSVLPPLMDGHPTGDEPIPTHVKVGFNRLIALFSLLDNRFLELWASQVSPHPLSSCAPVTLDWIEAKQSELDRDEADTAASQETMAADGHEPLTELQLADLFITRLWMRTLLWQIALSSGLLRSHPDQASHEGLSLHFPAQRISSQLRSLVTRLKNISSVATHGSGILEKLFEIMSTVADVLVLPLAQGSTRHEDQSRMDDFVFLVQFLLGFERVSEQQRLYMQKKMEDLQAQYQEVDFRLDQFATV